MQNNKSKNRSFKAFCNSILTVSEWESWIKYMKTDLSELHFQLMTTAKGELKKRLRKTQHDYERRFVLNSKQVQNMFRHTYSKVMIFLEEEIEKLQSEEQINKIKENLKSLHTINKNEKELISKNSVKKTSEITHYETLIALHYLVYRANSNVKLDMTKIVKLLFFLRREKIDVKISDTSEYKQIKSMFQNDKSKRKPLFKTHGKNASAFLKSIGILDVANLIEKEIID